MLKTNYPSLVKRCKAALGLFLVMMQFVLCFVSIYCAYIAIMTRHTGCLIYIITLMTYQIFFAKKSQTYINFIRWFQIENYFNNFTYEAEEPFASERCVLTLHPHCVYSIGLLANLNFNIHNMSILGSRFALNTPILGLTLKWWGVLPVNPQFYKQYCREGKNIAIVPGGFEEATLTSRHEERIYIKNRKGFIKYALENGQRIYPAYVFNESQCFYTFDKFLKFRLLLNKIKLVGVLFFSWYLILFPDPFTQINTVVGKPIQMPKIDTPTIQDVDKYHQIYIETITALYYKYQNKYCYEQKKKDLIIY